MWFHIWRMAGYQDVLQIMKPFLVALFRQLQEMPPLWKRQPPETFVIFPSTWYFATVLQHGLGSCVRMPVEGNARQACMHDCIGILAGLVGGIEYRGGIKEFKANHRVAGAYAPDKGNGLTHGHATW